MPAANLAATPHAVAVVAVLALYATLRARVLDTQSPGAATMEQWEPIAAMAAAGSTLARAMAMASRSDPGTPPLERGVAALAAALPIAGRVAQLTAASLLLTASPAAGAWLVAAAGTAAALVPAAPTLAPGSPADAALPATTPAAAAEAAAASTSARPYILLAYDPAGGARAAAVVGALARFVAQRGAGSGVPPTFARLDAARWPEAAAKLVRGGHVSVGEGPPLLPAAVVWEGGRAVRRVEGGRAPTTVGGWERALLL